MKRMARGVFGSHLAWVVCLAWSVAPDAAEPATLESRKPQIPELKVETYTLPNGLTVILHEDHKTPVVSVNVLYKVGSKDEKKGRTGFAHLFEHMMFLGSKHHDDDFTRPLEKLGAANNAETDNDRTEYYETVPTNALELALWLEADRMGFLLPAMTQEKLDSERDVVKNERRQTVDNVPYGQAEELLLEALYPADHPYHHSVIGSMADLSAAALADVAAFFRTYYVPNNAIICVAGDFQPARAKQWIEKYFGPLSRGPEVKRQQQSVPSVSAGKHIRATDAVSLPSSGPVDLADGTGQPSRRAGAGRVGGRPGGAAQGEPAVSCPHVRPAACGRSRGVAPHPDAFGATFEVELTARPGEKLDDLVKIADAEIERLKKDGPTPLEVKKAQNDRESALIMGLQAVTRKASVLNQSMETHGDPLGYRSELEKVFNVTAEEVKRVARQYLGAKRIEVDILPGAPASRPPEVTVDRSKQVPLSSPPLAEVKDAFDRSVMPELGPIPHYVPPRFARRALSDGLELLIVERHELPIVTVDLIVKSGETSAPKGKEGLASLAAGLLDEGTKTRDSLQIAGEQAEIGATLSAAGGLESTTVNLTTLTRHLERALDLYADIVLNPSFPWRKLFCAGSSSRAAGHSSRPAPRRCRADR